MSRDERSKRKQELKSRSKALQGEEVTVILVLGRDYTTDYIFEQEKKEGCLNP